MEARLRHVERTLGEAGLAVGRGGGTDDWDLEVRPGAMAGARLLGTIEEHGHGRQLVRWRVTPTIWSGSLVVLAAFLVLTIGALRDGAWPAAAVSAAVTVAISVRTILDAGSAVQAIGSAVDRPPAVP